MNVVLDTNILVSAFWTPNGKAAYVVRQIIDGKINLCCDSRILSEYREVLLRPKFHFDHWQINSLLELFEKDGIFVVANPLPDILFVDESDKMFFEVAKFCNAPLVTGNLKHYPQDNLIMSLTDYFLLINQFNNLL